MRAPLFLGASRIRLQDSSRADQPSLTAEDALEPARSFKNDFDCMKVLSYREGQMSEAVELQGAVQQYERKRRSKKTHVMGARPQCNGGAVK